MYNKLHTRLALLFTGIAGMILIAMSVCYLYMSEKELNENHFLTFSSNVNTLISTLEQQDTLTWEWLLKTSTSQSYILALYDNDTPLSYNRTVLSKENLALADELMAYAKKSYVSEKVASDYYTAHQEFAWMSKNGGHYLASIFKIRKNSATLTGIILSPKLPFQQQLFRQRIRFLILNIAGIVILFLFSYYFTGKLLSPIIESRKKQSAFISAASHELRTPTAVICSAVSAAKSANSIQKEHFLHIVEEESLRLSTLVDDLLLLNRADSGRLSLDLKPVELDTLLLNTFESFEPLAKEHGITLKISLPTESIPRCNCDCERIKQVLGILISNALSYGKTGGYVKLSLSHNRSLFWIAVEDNGIGILDKDKPFIFDRFYRADSSRSQKEHFGLGLCIAKEIIESHKGSISVADTPGGGTRFFILLSNSKKI